MPLVSLKIRLLRALGLLHFPPVRRRLGLVVDALDGMQQAGYELTAQILRVAQA